VIAASEAAGDGAAGISGKSVGDPPFPSLCLGEIATDRTGESDRAWSRNG